MTESSSWAAEPDEEASSGDERGVEILDEVEVEFRDGGGEGACLRRRTGAEITMTCSTVDVTVKV